MTLYAIGDIHGYADQLDQALERIARDGGPEAEVVFLGDYTDRGPDSRGVLDRLIEGRDAGRNWRFVMGNHDRMFLNFVSTGEEHDSRIKSGLSWMNPRLGGRRTLASYGIGERSPSFLHDLNGGRETLTSYGLRGATMTAQELIGEARAAVPQAHVNFLATLPLTHVTDEHIFVHAGIRPGIALDAQEEDDLLWIRDGFLEDDRDHGRLVVHGHTALDRPEHFGNRVNLDGGAGYGNALIPAVFEGRECWLLTANGRERLSVPD